MIFNTETSPAINMDAIAESKYEVGIEGALMHIYETECNYNALMKAAGLSELKYFKETGGDLFVNEAGALKGFVAKAKAMFKAVIDKIVAMFKKFFMLINSYVRDDKTFLKKYQTAILRKQSELTGFEFKGYKFDGLDNKVNNLTSQIPTVEKEFTSNTSKQFDNVEEKDIATNDEVKQIKDALRGNLIGKGELEDSEFKSDLKEFLYGDGKDTLENISLSAQINIISSTDANIKAVKKCQDSIITLLNKEVKNLENIENQYVKSINDKNNDKVNRSVKAVNIAVDILKSVSSDLTYTFGVVIQAYKDRNRQAKAICVKAVSYKNKNEAASLSESAYGVDDIFADVVIQ